MFAGSEQAAIAKRRRTVDKVGGRRGHYPPEIPPRPQLYRTIIGFLTTRYTYQLTEFICGVGEDGNCSDEFVGVENHQIEVRDEGI